MADVFTQRQRSQVMRAVLGQGTAPEVAVQQLVRRLGYRPRCNDPGLPGEPDLVFPRRKKVIFVHGCFWHRHACEAGRSTPASNQDYWLAKFARNRRRDARVKRALRAAGWSSLVVWECQLRSSRIDRLQTRLAKFLRSS